MGYTAYGYKLQALPPPRYSDWTPLYGRNDYAGNGGDDVNDHCGSHGSTLTRMVPMIGRAMFPGQNRLRQNRRLCHGNLLSR